MRVLKFNGDYDHTRVLDQFHFPQHYSALFIFMREIDLKLSKSKLNSTIEDFLESIFDEYRVIIVVLSGQL